MPVAHADNRRRRLVLPRSAPAVARTRQRLAQFLLQHRARTPSSIASNQSSKSKPSAAAAASFVVSFVMAWSPFQRSNAGIIWVEQPADYANPIPTTSATGPRGSRLGAETHHGIDFAQELFELPRSGLVGD